ncbi:peptidoglycan DD-metalloendopeptidase family protein [Candidatus Peregrinibacteria bacterium]|nr:peptidoglycan DD-metalloendopeptidase family protein [Candidatus Peregrinibacteria bacterium]
MNKLALKISAICVVLALFAGFNFESKPAFAKTSLDLLPLDSEKQNQFLNSEIKKKIKLGAYFLFGIESRLKQSKGEIGLLKDSVRALQKKINESNVQMNKLESQLENLDRLIALNKEKIGAGELIIGQKKNKIKVLEGDLKQKEKDLTDQFESLDSVMNAYYLQNNVFFDKHNNEPLLLAFLSDEGSIGETLRENEYLFLMQIFSRELAENIMKAEDELNKKRKEIEQEREKLADIQNMLVKERQIFIQSQASRQRLLKETKGRQIIYETLLELAKKEEAQVSLEIKRLQENYEFFQSKLDELGKNPEAYSIKPEELGLNEDELILNAEDKPLSWPVSPALGLTAYFRDPAYQKALGIPHNAIDIRLAQESRVRSAANGIVSKVADNGFSYSYVIISHPDKIITLYGHLSEIFVTEGEIVRQGQTIGLSGGIPGTRGAGWLTTGAHLHFEVLQNFTYADPLDYLPLEYVPLGSLPEKYLDRLTGEEKIKIQRSKSK